MIEPLFKSKPLYKDWIFYLLLILAIAALIVSLRGLDANAQVINAKGSAGVPVSFGQTATTVLDAKVRKTWMIHWTDTGNLRCEPIYLGSTSPAVTPSATVGFLMDAAHAPWSSNNLTDNPSLGWSCYCTSGTCNVNTYEGF